MDGVSKEMEGQTQLPETQRQVIQNRVTKVCANVLQSVSKSCDSSKAVETSTVDETLLSRIEQLEKQIKEAQHDVERSREQVSYQVFEVITGIILYF